MPKKKVKYIRMYQDGNFPETRKERDKLYRFLEATGIMKQIFSSREILIRKE